jgi:hypothetical protein
VIGRVFRVLPLLVLACMTDRPPLEEKTGDRSALVSTREILGHFLMRQQLHYRFAERRSSFEAVVQKRCDEVIVIGFAPFGARAFTIHQHGLAVTVESDLPVPWPFPPGNILLDIHRTFFLPIPEAPPPDGDHESTHAGAIVRERWSSGRLIQRSIHRSPEDAFAETVITYIGGARRGPPPREIRLENRRYGYRIDVTTVAYEPLTCSE